MTTNGDGDADPTRRAATGPPAGRRRRDPEASRGAILDAARAELNAHGYSRMTIRRVAARAGVTHGLVMRHFGTKERLFLAAIPGPQRLGAALAGDPATLPERIARAYVDRMETADADDPFVALIRSAAANDPTATRLYSAMQEHSRAAYRDVLDGPDVDARVDLIAAVLLGVTFSRYVIREGAVAAMAPATLAEHLTALLRPVVLPASGTAPGD
ncbi:TetR family transcriptional regulator [Streptomyces sp. Z26]|uniref:TetR/AcrR family transcriptional regulator n=1 Tax=Streptomyces sp. Z26 TaxID=2500177 RepID=UPI000EF15ED7|nr:TetR family transcriptional regulator [Streptomyces sp. Z26]RLL69387.1 TetR/AcrR family transcriptional regulator [Streptomyces sp. Z26]